MPLPKQPRFEVFDPRLGKDFVTQTGKTTRVSSLAQQLLVIDFYPGRIAPNVDTPPSLSQSDLYRLTVRAMQAVGRIGFFSITPFTSWHKRRPELSALQVEERNKSAIGYFNLDLSNIERILGLRCRNATYSEWTIGSCEERLSEPTEVDWYERTEYSSSSFLLNQIDNLCFISAFFGETGELITYTKIFDGLDDYLRLLVASKPKKTG